MRASSGKAGLERRFDRVHFAASRRRAGAGQDRAARGEERGVLDEAAVGVARVRRQHGERDARGLERRAVVLVLDEREFRVRRAFTRLGQSLRKVFAGQPEQCVGEYHGAGTEVSTPWAISLQTCDISFTAPRGLPLRVLRRKRLPPISSWRRSISANGSVS